MTARCDLDAWQRLREAARATPGTTLVVKEQAATVTARSWRDRMPYWGKRYARRADLHDQIKRAVNVNGRVALVGLPGFGKTRLGFEGDLERENGLVVVDGDCGSEIWPSPDRYVQRSQCDGWSVAGRNVVRVS